MSSKEKHQPKRQRAVSKTITTTTEQADSLLEDVSQKSEEETTITNTNTTSTANMTSTEETGGSGGYSSSEEMDDELKMLDSREFSPIKPNDVDDGGQEQQEPHATMYSSAVSHTQEMFATAGGKTTTTNFISPHTDADALESDGELLDLEHDLPETVTVLKTKDNSHTIYLIGTSHFSKQSHRDVRRVIRTVRPSVVMLELCRSRMCFLTMNESEIMSEAKSLDFSKIRDYMKKNGFVQGFIYTLLLTASAKVTNDLDMAPGGEFRNAFNEAVNVPDCQIMLGDRPVDITLRRAISTLSTWQKIKMTYNCLFTSETLNAEELERYKQKDVLEQLIGELSEEFPGLSRVMVEERDQYLAHSLLDACHQAKPGEPVVGVVGIGHSAGIKAHWDTVESINVAELVTIPTSKPSKTMLVIRYSFYGLVGYGVYRYVLPKAAKSLLVQSTAQVAAKVAGVFSR
ncbi:hypothetical protein TYRP_011727 [Tyrophagus putrescentiae]|nr:hypothetical protein TYRP_011727 [Tyrophagus putrescentiae]